MSFWTFFQAAVVASFVVVYALTLSSHAMPDALEAWLGLAILAAGNLFFYRIGARLLAGVVLWWSALPRMFRGELGKAVVRTMRSHMASISWPITRFGLKCFLGLLLVLGWLGHQYGLYWVIGPVVALFALSIMELDALMRPPVILFLGPSDDLSISLLAELQRRFPSWRIATMVGREKSFNKKLARVLIHGHLRRRRGRDNLAWIDGLDQLIELARIYILDARLRMQTEHTFSESFARLSAFSPSLVATVQKAIGVEGSPSAAAWLQARPELLDGAWVSPELQLEASRVLLTSKKDRADRTVVVVDSGGTAPLLDKLFREREQLNAILYCEPAHKATVEEVATAVESLVEDRW